MNSFLAQQQRFSKNTKYFLNHNLKNNNHSFSQKELSTLESLLKLIDDPSEYVQEAIKKQFKTYGLSLFSALKTLKSSPTPNQLKLLEKILIDDKLHYLIDSWKEFINNTSKLSFYKNLEIGYNIFYKYFNNNFSNQNNISFLIDELSNKIKRSMYSYKKENDFEILKKINRYLFSSELIKASKSLSTDDIELSEVMKNLKGSPISLSSIFVLVAQRFNINLDICLFAKKAYVKYTDNNGNLLFFDPFSQGKIYTIEYFKQKYPHIITEVLTILNSKIDTYDVFKRILENLTYHFYCNNLEKESQNINQLHQLTHKKQSFFNKSNQQHFTKN